MLEVLEHRGRDHRGMVQARGHWVGHNRLAIVDLSESGNQPLVTRDGVVAFNGEIYNYLELYDSMLEIRGRPRNEVWVLSQLLRQHHQFWRVVDGYYALVYFDWRYNRIVLSRDMVGVIPLYYELVPGGIEVASEKKALTNPIEVGAGETLTFSLDGRMIDRHVQDFYSMHLAPIDLPHLKNLFMEAVKKRLVHSDVPVCIALSGGLDSSMVMAAAHQIRGGYYGANLQAITVGIDSESEEVANARKYCAQLGVDHQVVLLTKEQIEAEREKILWYLEDPIPNKIKYAAMIRNYFVAKHAPGTVILCGEGADEIGCGYPSHARTQSQMELEWKSLSTLRSMPAINMDRVNKGGMAWTKEYRVPFLDRALVLYLMGVQKQLDKQYFRYVAKKLGVPEYILNKKKYSTEEDRLWSIVSKWR